jgi:uncharacterized protein (UPF0335 family)
MAGELFELDTNKSSSTDAPTKPAETKKAKSTNGVDNKQLLSIVERIERMTEEKKAIADDIKEIKLEAKSNGYDVKTITDMLKLRAMDKADRDEREALRDTYANALGIFG